MDPFDEYLPAPPEFDNAPAWAHALWRQQRKDYHRLANGEMALHSDIRAVQAILGEKPNSDGTNGKGLLGDVHALMQLRMKAIGFVAAIGLTGAVLILGVAHWVQSVMQGTK